MTERGSCKKLERAVVRMKLRPWLFLAVSILIIAGALALSHVAEIIRERRDELIRELDTIVRVRLLDVEREQKNELEQRNQELEEALINLNRTCRIVAGADPGAAPLSRGGHERLTAITMPLDMPSGFTAERLERAFAGTALAGIGEALVEAERETGINALVLAGIIAHETGWGTSALARDKNNMAGLGAYDGCEYSSGITFDSRTASIMFLAELLAVKYAPGGCYFGGSHDLQGIGIRYASDPGWACKVAGCVRVIVER